MPHVVERPGVFYDEHGYPLGFVVDSKHDNTENESAGIDYEKDNIKKFFMPRHLFVIGDVQKPISQFHTLRIPLYIKIVYHNTMPIFILSLALFFGAHTAFAASSPKGTPLFYQNGSVVGSVVCGDTYSFDVAGYSNQTVWVEMKKDGTTIFDGLFSLPMQPYTSVCNTEANDAGRYVIATYAVENGNKGEGVASAVFTVIPTDTADLFSFRSHAPGILSIKLPVSDKKADLLFYFLRKYRPDMDQIVFVPTNSWLRSQGISTDYVENQGGPQRALVEGIGVLPNDNIHDLGDNTRLFGIAYIPGLRNFNKDRDSNTGSLTHEIGHNWGVRIVTQDALGNKDPLGLSSLSHWGPFTDNFDSIMAAGPARIIDNKNGTFKIEWKAKRTEQVFNDFDLYAMGLLPAESVRPTFVISKNGVSRDQLEKEIIGTAYRGGTISAQKKKDITINDMMAIEGRRKPAYGLTKNNTTNNLRVSFIILQGPDGDENELQDVLANVKDAAGILPAEWSRATRNFSSASVFDPVAKPRVVVSSFAATLSQSVSAKILENTFISQTHGHLFEVSQSSPDLGSGNTLDQLERQLSSLLKSLERATGEILCQVPSTALARHDENSEVTKLQRFLSQFTHLYPEQSVIGYFGPATERAVTRFQDTFGIPKENGVVGDLTRAMMRSLCGE